MKHVYKTMAIFLLSLPLGSAVYAAEHDMSGMAKHEGGMPGMEMHDGMPGMGMPDGMPGMGRHGDMMSLEHLKERQAHMLIMHDLSNKILAEKDPKKQQALKDQQLEVMKAHMKEMMAKHHKMRMSHPAPPPPAAPAPEATKK